MVICCGLPAHSTRRSPVHVSLQVRVFSPVTLFHCSHFASTVSAKRFHTAGASATAASRFSLFSSSWRSTVILVARYSCAARLVFSSMARFPAQYPTESGASQLSGNRVSPCRLLKPAAGVAFTRRFVGSPPHL